MKLFFSNTKGTNRKVSRLHTTKTRINVAPVLLCALLSATVTSSCKPRKSAELLSKKHNNEDKENIFTSDKTKNELFKVEIKFEKAKNFEKLRNEGRSLAEKINECKVQDEEIYSEFTLDKFKINDESTNSAVITKKGYLGSLSAAKPSFKIKIKNDKESFLGQSTFALNADRQDPTHIRQCLSYWFFAKAGVKGPGCRLAHVKLKSDDKEDKKELHIDAGIFTMVEDFKTSLLAGLNEDKHVSLVAFEGTHADFSATGKQRIELKTKDVDPSGIETSTEALNQLTNLLSKSPEDADDANDRFAKIGEIVDLDHFYKYWTTETIIGHWDGYANNMNNFFIYFPFNTKTKKLGKLRFVPWGTDGTFISDDIINRENAERAKFVSTNGSLANWLFRFAPSRKIYISTLKNNLETLGNQESIEEFNRIASLVESVQNAQDEDYKNSKARIKTYLTEQSKTILTQLSDFESKAEGTSSAANASKTESSPISEKPGLIQCWVKIAQISGNITATLDSFPGTPQAEFKGSTNINLTFVENDKLLPPTKPEIIGSTFILRPVSENTDVSLNVVFSLPGSNALWSFTTVQERKSFVSGRTAEHLGYSNMGVLLAGLGDLSNPAKLNWLQLGLMGGGSSSITEAPPEISADAFPRLDLLLPKKPRAKIQFHGDIFSKVPLAQLKNKLKLQLGN